MKKKKNNIINNSNTQSDSSEDKDSNDIIYEEGIDSENSKSINFTNSSNVNTLKISYLSNANEKNNLTPFREDEINQEIYPNEILFNEKNHEINNTITTLECGINNTNLDNLRKINNCNYSICSTEISFTLNSEYENINELSDYKYSKDLKLKQKVHRILKNEEEKKRKLVNEEEIELIYFKSLSKVTSNPEEPKKTKIRKNRRSISYFKSNEQKIKSIFKSSNSNETEIGKSKKINNKKTFKKKNYSINHY